MVRWCFVFCERNYEIYKRIYKYTLDIVLVLIKENERNESLCILI